MRAQLRRKTRFYFCPEGRDSATKNRELGVIAQHPFLGTSVDSARGNGEADLLREHRFSELTARLNCLR